MSRSTPSRVRARTYTYWELNVEKLAYSVDEAVKASGLGRTTIFECIRSGQLVSVKVGRRRVIPADALRRLVGAEVGQAA